MRIALGIGKGRFRKTAETPLIYGAGDKTRTYDLMITNQLLYQLSYTGGCERHGADRKRKY